MATCFDQAPLYPQLPNSGYLVRTDMSWVGALVALTGPNSGTWASMQPQNCSYFDVNPEATCASYRWPDVSPRTRCCACGGGTSDAPSPPLPPAAPTPPSPPCYDDTATVVQVVMVQRIVSMLRV